MEIIFGGTRENGSCIHADHGRATTVSIAPVRLTGRVPGQTVVAEPSDTRTAEPDAGSRIGPATVPAGEQRGRSRPNQCGPPARPRASATRLVRSWGLIPAGQEFASWI